MWVLPTLDLGQRCEQPAVFRVTVLAGCERVDGVHAPMRRHQVLHLGWNILMTYQAAVLHGLVFPWRNMTGAAGTGNFSMRCHAAQHGSMDIIQRPGAEHLTTARKGIPCDGERSDQRGNDAGSSQATQPGFTHLSLYPLLFQKGRIIQRRTDMHERGNEQGHADRDVDGVPQRH